MDPTPCNIAVRLADGVAATSGEGLNIVSGAGLGRLLDPSLGPRPISRFSLSLQPLLQVGRSRHKVDRKLAATAANAQV